MAVDYATVNDTATAGQDYPRRPARCTSPMADGATIVVPVADDILDEPPETWRGPFNPGK